MVVAALGDLLLDVVVRLDTALNFGADATASTRTGAGGQAANVAAWAASLGAEARFVGKRGSDAAAELAAREVSSRGVELFGPVEEGRNGVVVSQNRRLLGFSCVQLSLCVFPVVKLVMANACFGNVRLALNSKPV